MFNRRAEIIFRLITFYSLFVARYSLILFLFASTAHASGEIAFVRAPEEIPEGDDITVIVSASPRETGIDRTLAIDFPASWKLKRAYRVEAGSDHSVHIPQSGEISSLFSKEPGDNVLAFADVSDDFDPNADGIAYFIVFTTKSLPSGKADQSATVKAALVERSNPDAPREIDPKTKRAKPVNTEWRMVFPPKLDFSFAGITSKRLIATIRLERISENARALVAEGKKNAIATLHTRPELLAQFFDRPFSIECWFRTTGIQQTFLQFGSDKTKLQLGTGLLGQPLLRSRGAENKVIEAVRAIVNDGTWHNVVLSRDSSNKLRLFIDAGPPTVVDLSNELFQNITSVEIGDSASENDFSIDELRLSRSAYRDPLEFEQAMVTSARDTSQQAFAIFHFDEFGSSARSSVPLLVKFEQKG
ncbi:MAG TPA: LamG-like jellyroll fold domain-containing protein, partial [Candidatus Kapabacteria bacterium]|nr:LamG-like jellyroll fold domain-containing protein [Candidatus Kapabacteria bacterium]